MKFKKSIWFGVLLTGLSCGAATLHLAGDSTLAPRKESESARSWGEALRPHLKDGNEIINCAFGGASTVTFRKVWEEKLLGKIKPGDFVLIQFGHNDCWHTEKRYERPGVPDRFCTPDEYKSNIKRFIAEVRERNAIPVLLSPTPQRRFSKDGAFEGISGRHKPYFEKLPELAAEEKIDFLDMTTVGTNVITALGAESTKELFMCKVNGKDNVHPIASGARLFAELFLIMARTKGLSVANLFKP